MFFEKNIFWKFSRSGEGVLGLGFEKFSKSKLHIVKKYSISLKKYTD